MTTTADIVVIGGGIAGIGAAARLSGSANVVVLESEDVIGRHATGRSAAIFIKNYGNASLRALNAASEPLLATGGDLSDTPFLTPRGELVVATAGEEGDLESYLDGSDGLERVTPAEAVAMFPILNPEYVVAAALERAAQDIDVDRLLQAYARMARHNGARVVASAPATRITRTGGVWQVEAGGETYAAPILINAAGAWADTVAERAGVRPAGLVPLRRSAAILPAPEGCDVTGWPALVSASETWYAKPEAGKLMVSPADEDPVEPHDAWPEDMVLAEGLHRYEQAMSVPVTRVERSWAGLRTFTADRTPVVGFDPEAEGFFWLAGQGGYGIQTSPVLSELAAALCLSQSPDLPASLLAALSPARLARA